MKLQRRTVRILAALVVVAGALGFAVFALAGGLDRTVTAEARGGGTQVVRVALVDAAVGFDVTPDRVVVARGTRLILEVVNDGDEAHDLALDGGPRTRRLAPGESQRLDLGVVDRSLPTLYCTLPGHRIAGMTLDVRVEA